MHLGEKKQTMLPSCNVYISTTKHHIMRLNRMHLWLQGGIFLKCLFSFTHAERIYYLNIIVRYLRFLYIQVKEFRRKYHHKLYQIKYKDNSTYNVQNVSKNTASNIPPDDVCI